MLSQDDAERVENYLHPDQRPLQELLLFQIAESVQSTREHTHPSRGEDLYCLNQVAWRGERMGAVLKRLLDESAEARRLTAVLERVESVLNELRRNPEPDNANDLYGLGRRVVAQLEAALYLKSEHSGSSAPETGPRFEDPQGERYRDALAKIRIRVMQVCDFDSTESAAPQDEAFAREMDELNTYVRELTDGMEL